VTDGFARVSTVAGGLPLPWSTSDVYGVIDARAVPTADFDADDKNRPLVEDIRLLGRILGDVIREQEGREAFELIERIRRL